MARENRQLSHGAPPIERLEVSVFELPTDGPEADGTLSWSSTTMVLVELHAAGRHGLGYTYAVASVAELITEHFAPLVLGSDAMRPQSLHRRLDREVRNFGRSGLCALAVSAVDAAAWDLKARLLGLPLAVMLGAVRDEVPIYGSGGFTSYDEARIRRQLEGWVAAGIPRVKIKVGSDPAADPGRVLAAREAAGDDVELFVDANGAYDRKQALDLAVWFRQEAGVTWFEEPVSSEDVRGLRLIRDRAPAGMEIAAGEYGFVPADFLRLLEAEAVDCLQADEGRCGGVTGLLEVAALCVAFEVPLSLHNAPAQHLHPACALPRLRHLEYFHDHVRFESRVFDGVAEPVNGTLAFDASRTGTGLELAPGAAELRVRHEIRERSRSQGARRGRERHAAGAV